MTRWDGTLVFVCAAVFCTVAVPAVAGVARGSHRLSRRQAAAEDCTTELARDLYGLGVRLGVGYHLPVGFMFIALTLTGILPVVLRMGSQYLHR